MIAICFFCVWTAPLLSSKRWTFGKGFFWCAQHISVISTFHYATLEQTAVGVFQAFPVSDNGVLQGGRQAVKTRDNLFFVRPLPFHPTWPNPLFPSGFSAPFVSASVHRAPSCLPKTAAGTVARKSSEFSSVNWATVSRQPVAAFPLWIIVKVRKEVRSHYLIFRNDTVALSLRIPCCFLRSAISHWSCR